MKIIPERQTAMYKFGQYIPSQTPIHTLDPRVKIIAVLAISIIIMQSSMAALAGVATMVLACAHLAKIPAPTLLKTLRPVLPLLGFLFLIYLLFTPGHALPGFPIGPLQITYQGLYLGIQQVGKFFLLVAVAALLTMTTSTSEITIGLERLLRPLRAVGISSHDIAMMISLALRFIPTLIDEMNSIREAQLARGANLKPPTLAGKARVITNLAIPLSTNVLRRCDELVDAMEARGYQQGSRTYLRQLTLTQADYFIIIAFITAAVLAML